MSLKINFMNTLSTRLFSMIFGFINVIIYARVMGPANYGIGILLLIFPPILIKFLDFGVSDALVYFSNKFPEQKKEFVGTIFTFAILQSLITSTILFISEPLLSQKYFKTVNVTELFYLIAIMTSVICINFYLKGILKALVMIKKYNYITVIIAPMLNFIFTVLLVAILKLGIHGYVYSGIITAVFETILMVNFLLKGKTVFFCFNLKHLGQMFRFGLKGFFANFYGEMIDKLDRLIIGYYLPIEQVGIYQIALNFSNKLRIIHQSLGLPLYPKIASMYHTAALSLSKKLFNLLLWPTFILVMLSLFAAYYFIGPLFGTRFEPAVLPFILLALGVIFDSQNTVIGYFYLGTGNPTIFSIQKILYLSINALCLIIFIPVIGIAGAGLAGLGSSLITFVVGYNYFKKNQDIRSERIYKLEITMFKELFLQMKSKKNLQEIF